MKYGYLGLLPVCICLIAPAQSTNATISGGVADPSGHLIVNADVEIANDTTGIVYSATTNNLGMYLVPVLPPGHYHVQVSKPGFKTIIKADVVLNVQSALALNFTLPVGATSESVTVDAASAPINTTDGSVSTVVDSKFVQNMPLNDIRPDSSVMIGDSLSDIEFGRRSGARVVVLSNQRGIARGLYTCDDVGAIHAHLQQILHKEGAHIDGLPREVCRNRDCLRSQVAAGI